MMDTQTLYDLDIFPRDAVGRSVYEMIHCFTLTTGGKEALQRRMLQPAFDAPQVRQAQQTVRFLLQHLAAWKQSFSAQEMKYLEEYFHSNLTPLEEVDALHRWWYRWQYASDYAFIQSSIQRVAVFIRKLFAFVDMPGHQAAEILNDVHRICDSLYTADQNGWLTAAADHTLNSHQVFYLDHFIRVLHKTQFISLLQAFYTLDALFACAEATQVYHFTFPVLTDPGQKLELRGLYHVFLPEGIRNDVHFDQRHPFIFLTGPNMAGKSTLLKACGIAVYLAHLGMGVPAREAVIPIFDGVFTDIYITDRVEQGYSYFFSEVRRIQELAEQLKAGKRMFILIDEMFRGTNVRDAYDCSLAVASRLAALHNSYTLFASHLTELAHALQSVDTIRFCYFDASVRNQQPYFNYRLREGVSDVRLGQVILRQQGVLDLLDQGIAIARHEQDTTG
jgi:DNA mismatch repair protein MutS